MTDSPLYSLSCEQLEAAYRVKRLSPVEVTEAVLARIEACNDAVNAFVVLDPDKPSFPQKHQRHGGRETNL